MRPKGRIFLYPGAGPRGRNKFTIGTFEDLNAEGITPTEGMNIAFYCDDDDPLLFEGAIHYDSQLQHWYALIDENSYRQRIGR